MVRLGDIATVITKGTTPTSLGYSFESDGINFIKIESIAESGEFIEEKFGHISEQCNLALFRSQLQENDILFSIAGAIGRTAIVTKNVLPANINQALAIIRVPKDRINHRFLNYSLHSSAITAQFEKKKQGVAQLNISLGDIRDFQIPDICLQEQENIVSVLDKINGLISLRNKQLQKLDDLVKSRFVVLMEKADLGEETTIDSITERVKVGFVGTCEKHYTDESGIPMLRTGNITEKGIDLSDLKYVTAEFHNKNKKSQIHTGDLLIARHGSNGQANVYYGPEAQCLNAVVIVPNQKIASSVFLAGLINSPAIKRQIEQTLVGSTQHVINTKSIAGLTVRIPDVAIQIEYESFVAEVDKSRLTIQQGLDKLEQMKQALMQKYFG